MSNKFSLSILTATIVTAILAAFFFSLAATVVPYFYTASKLYFPDDGSLNSSIGPLFLLLAVRYVSTFTISSVLNNSPKKTKSKATHTRLIFISIFQALFIASYMFSIKLIPLSLAVVVIYTFPIITFFVNSLIKGRSIDFLSVAALLVSLLGIWVLVQGDTSDWNLWGIFWGMVASLAQVTVNILSRHESVESGWGLVKYITVLPSIAFVLIYFIVIVNPIASVSSEMLIWSLLSAIGMSGGFYFFFRSITLIGPVRTSNVMYLEPIFTIILGVILLQDKLGQSQWIGMLIIFIATISLERWGKKYN